MQFDFNFYSSLLLITFSQGLIYSFLLLKKGIQTENTSNYWLSLFVFICSLYVAPWMLGFAGWYDKQPYRDFMFYVPFQHLFFIGPVLYFYIQSLLNPAFRLHKKHILHLVPGILYLVYIASLFVYDKLIAKEYYFYKNGMDKDFDQWYQISGQLSMLFYFIICLKYYSNYKKLVVEITSNANDLLFSWIKNYLVAFSIMLVLPIIFDLFSNVYPELKSYTGNWWFYLLYSLVLFYIAITGYGNNAVTQIGFQFKYENNNLVYYLTDNNSTLLNVDNIVEFDYDEVDKVNPDDLHFWKTAIENLMQTDSIYKNPEVSLPDLAKKLKTNVAVVSKTINQGFGMNFNDYINQYRISEVKKAFDIGKHKKSTLLGIAYDCGFNSKATFNRAFKKNTGFSPKDYLAQL